MSHKRDVIRRVRLFSTLGDTDCDALLAVIKARRGAPGDVLFAEGDTSTSLLIVVEGSLAVRAGDLEVARLSPGDVVGEMALDPAPRSATVVAREATLVIEVSRDALLLLRRDAPFVAAAIHRGIIADVAKRLREVNQRIERQLDGTTGVAVRPSLPNPRPRGPSLTAAQLRMEPGLREYGDSDLELLARATALRSFLPKEVLFDEGSIGDSCFLLLRGELDVVRKQGDRLRILASLKPGSLVGQLALIDRAPRSASVIASVESHALELGKDTFDRLIHAHSAMALRFQEQVAIAGIRQLRSATARVRALVEQRNDANAYMSGPSVGDDWDDPVDAGGVLELAIDPQSLRR